MIIQTGLRTDIPAFYAEWFYNRICEGYVLVRNPYNPKSVTRYSLSPDVVDLIGFCTKNPSPMFTRLDLLKPYGMYWFVTITLYGKDIEPNVPAKEQVIDDFKRLSGIVGKNSIGWRYDPVFINEKYTVEEHIAGFESMASDLSGYTDTCVISFIDLYNKVKRNFPEARAVAEKDKIKLGKAFIQIARSYGMKLKTCAEGDGLAVYGADCSGCMTIETYEKALNARLNIPGRRQARKECACYLSADIGMYDTCGNLCRYCYANTNAASAIKNIKMHNPGSPLLTGGLCEDDIIHEAVQKSFIDRQLNIFDFEW